MAVWQDPLKPLDMGIWTMASYSFKSSSQSLVTSWGAGWDVDISAPRASI